MPPNTPDWDRSIWRLWRISRQGRHF